MNLAVCFNARLLIQNVLVASATTDKLGRVIQLSLTRHETFCHLYRALKHTAKFRLPLSDRKLFLKQILRK